MWGTVTKVSDENVKALAGLIKDIADHGGLNVAYDAFGIQPTDSLYVKPEDRGPHLVIFPSEYSFYLLSPLIKFTTTFTIVSISSVLLSAIIKVNATKALSAIRLCPSGA